jgi:hypothetical protein
MLLIRRERRNNPINISQFGASYRMELIFDKLVQFGI